jgi:ABC-type metal ion transport system substrate-binding protein
MVGLKLNNMTQRQSKPLTPNDIIDLKRVLWILQIQGIISFNEMLNILKMAGLSLNDDNTWVDKNGIIYSF